MRSCKIIWIILLSFLFFTEIHSAEFDCQDPPYYTLGEDLYPNSPSTQMEFTHVLIGLFQQLRAGENGRRQASPIGPDDQNARLAVIHDEYINGIRTTIITPHGIRNEKKIVYFHGGAYNQDLIFFQWEMALDLAIKAGSPVYVVHYDLVPDVAFPTPVNQGYGVYNKLIETTDPGDIVFMGDSAGGGLALGLAARLRDEGIPLPAQLVLISPWLDIAGDNPDMPGYDPLDQMLDVDGLQQSGLNYVGHDPELLDHPYASPLLVDDLDELPPCLFFIGNYEILYPDALLFKAKAEAQGMDLTFVEVNGGFHVWLGAPAWMVPESARSRRQVASFINCHVEDGRIAQADGLVTHADNDPSVRLYPNPGYGDFHLEIDAAGSREGTVEWRVDIYDLHGILRSRSSHVLEYGQTNIPVSSGIGSGIYRVHVSSGNFATTLPLMIR